MMRDVRTTLEIDPRVMAAARARARERGTTIGQEVSALALAGLSSKSAGRTRRRHGLVLLPGPSGHVVTDEMVSDALLEE